MSDPVGTVLYRAKCPYCGWKSARYSKPGLARDMHRIHLLNAGVHPDEATSPIIEEHTVGSES